MKLHSRVSVATASVLLVALTVLPAFALGATNTHANAEATNQPAAPGSQGATKLADAKLKACQRREKAIDNIMSRIADRGQKQLDLFSKIATKTETFYTEKGKTLSNYSTLVADVDAKKVPAQTVVDAVKANSVTFKCDGTDPKGASASFKVALKSETEALKAYKTAVKNLIVGVKSVQGTTTSTEKKTTGGNQ